ncbi:D-alanyl-D-alanine carboxypeptidase [Streptomyces sp. NPDC017979]|uniref:D-alanyl-D-alanine carboxypeptidase n=1 Tax=Streptomyces sp. NPDC017979 TaxID=3365024 RepID=UPI0037897CF0
MNQLHTPKASRNQETGRLSFMFPVSRRPTGSGLRGRDRGRDLRDGGRDRAQGRGRARVRHSGGLYRRLSGRVSYPITIWTGGTGTFSSVPALKKTVLTVAAASLLPLLAVAPASATAHGGKPAGAPQDRSTAVRKQPLPPAAMSTVGGKLLGRPGTQVQPRAGAPALPTELSGRSWIVADAESGDVLASHNAHWRLPPASTLKMLFADTVLPKLPKTDIHTVTYEDLEGVGPGSSSVGVKEGLNYSVHDLWLGVFLRSGNDAVHVLSAMNGGIDKTVQEMQAHAEELQALDTQVVSPDGYDASGQVSSAYDLTLIARNGLQKKDFREYAATVDAEFPGKFSGDKRDSFEIANTNRLLTGESGVTPYQGAAGVKNGYTSQAGYTFTGVAERGGKVLLVTVMNPDSTESQAVYRETARLFDWGFAAAGKVTPVGELVPPRSTTPVGAGPDKHSSQTKRAKAAAADESSGVGTALAIAGGVLVVLAGAVFVVNRRWPRRRA